MNVFKKLTSVFAMMTVLTVLFVVIARPASGQVVSSTFNTNAEGWTLIGDPTSSTPTWLGSGGNPGGFIHGVDARQVNTWFYAAPAAFLGNKIGAFGRTLTFDLREHPSGGTVYADSDVILTSGSTSLHLDLPPDRPSDTVWTHYIAVLDASAGWKVGSISGALATDTQIQAVLSNLTRLAIRGEFLSGVADNSDLDNVLLNGACAGIAQQPTSRVACPTRTATFSVAVVGTDVLTYQWQLQDPVGGGWINLSPSPISLACGGTATASVTPANAAQVTIAIRPCPSDNSAMFQRRRIRVVITNACGMTISNEASYTICPADFNCSGEVSVQDLFDFLICYFSNSATCDVNGNGSTTVEDIFQFLAAYFTGCS